MNKYLKYIIILYLIFISIYLLNLNLFENFESVINLDIDIDDHYVSLSDFNNRFNSNLKELPYRISAIGIDIDSDKKIYIYNNSNSLYLNRSINYWLNNIHNSLNKSKYYFILCYSDAYKFDEVKEPETTEPKALNHSEISYAPNYNNDYTIFAFSKRIDDKKTVLIPDPFYICNNGHSEKLDIINKNNVSWNSKYNECVWRGNKNLGLNINFFNSENKNNLSPRKYFLKLFFDKKIKNFSYDDNFMDIANLIKYKYILDIDGWTNTWDATVWKLYSGSVLLKVKSTWKQWYYDELKEYVHYVPVENDFSNLNEQIEWCINNETKCLEIIYNAREFVINKLNWDYVKNKTIENVRNFL